MKILTKKSTDIVIFGTNNNNAQVIIDGNYITIDSIRIYGLTEYNLIEDNNVQLPNPFFVGYQTYSAGTFQFTQGYLDWNPKAHDCISSVKTEYIDKSNNQSYTPEQRQSFLNYANSLTPIISSTYIQPGLQVPIPPDQDYYWQPNCMNGPE